MRSAYGREHLRGREIEDACEGEGGGSGEEVEDCGAADGEALMREARKAKLSI